MLDTDTKRRIDTARDILVGKLPDPKSQVEQITIALIYKFMDDMDAQSEELGGERSFFSGEFQKYGWARLMRGGLGGHEMLGLYSEAIARMPENPGIPPLFRDIFKNAFLPYRDPETLRAFLKVIDDFEYDHSERLGDAFEYLLSVLGSQGDAGQFRTPRHIIDFIVEIVDPKKDETVLDPACGTAGFLISAYKHILKTNTDENGNSTLTPDERQKLAANFRGYDISPDMVRLSLVNMYLHGFADPQIHEYDTLTSLDRWNEHADVILANPPFMSPKGGIQPHKRFSVQSKRSEVLFVDYIAEHMSPHGRAGVIVPEGLVFQRGSAYRQIRKLLLEESLVALVSLPAGVFNPYSGVRTSVLILDRELAKRASSVGFFRVRNDGFALGTQRRPVPGGELAELASTIAAYLDSLRRGTEATLVPDDHHLFVAKSRIAESGDYHLSGDRYREKASVESTYPTASLNELCEITRGSALRREQFQTGTIPVIAAGQEPTGYHNKANRAGETITVSASGAYAGYVAYFDRPIYATDCSTIKPRDARILTKYLYHVLKARQPEIYALQVGMGQPHVYPKQLGQLEVPLPPASIQEEMLAKVGAMERTIQGAQAVIDGYQPYFRVLDDWPEVALGNLCKIERGASPRPIHAFITDDPSGVNWIKIGDASLSGKYIDHTKQRITAEGARRSRRVVPGDLILSNSMSFGRPYVVAIEGCIHDGWLLLRPDSEKVEPDFLYYVLRSDAVARQFERVATGGVVRNLNSDLVRAVTVPLPSLTDQRLLASELDADLAVLKANRELICRTERRIAQIVGAAGGALSSLDGSPSGTG